MVLSMKVQFPVSSSAISAFSLNQFDLITVRIFDEGDDRRTMLHGSGFPHNVAAAGFDACTGVVCVFDFQGDMAIGRADLVRLGVPIMRQLDDGALAFFLITDKG